MVFPSSPGAFEEGVPISIREGHGIVRLGDLQGTLHHSLKNKVRSVGAKQRCSPVDLAFCLRGRADVDGSIFDPFRHICKLLLAVIYCLEAVRKRKKNVGLALSLYIKCMYRKACSLTCFLATGPAPMKSKLTLRLDEDLKERAKQLAKKRGTSVSKVVEDYFKILLQEDSPVPEGSEGGSSKISGDGSPTDGSSPGGDSSGEDPSGRAPSERPLSPRIRRLKEKLGKPALGGNHLLAGLRDPARDRRAGRGGIERASTGPALPRQPGLWWGNVILHGGYVLRPTGGRCAGSGASQPRAREKFHSNANQTDGQPPFSPMGFAR